MKGGPNGPGLILSGLEADAGYNCPDFCFSEFIA
jgi:hypothetical protein